MSDPVSVSLALGVAGNLATNVVQSFGDRIEDTRVGKSLAKIGLLKPGFDARLKEATRRAIVQFLSDNPPYGLPEVHNFLESKSFARDLREMILNQRGFDASKAMSRLETYIGVPLSEAPDSWPNRIDPELFVARLFAALVSRLGEDADPGLIWIGQAIADQGATLRNISDRLDLLVDRQESIHTGAIPDTHDNFRTAYIDHLVKRASRVSTPGARELRGINQSLSIAYISLNLKSAAGAEAVRAESFLAQHPHVAIRGPAGSGKTTLLNWLITKCQPSGSDDAGDKWKGYVPFFVPLRKVARLHSGPPSLDRLIEYSVDNKLWTLETPRGWINKIVAKEKRTILMIDGVDELPPSRRVEFWEWIGEFLSDYPENRVIITSRALPGAPGDGAYNEQCNPPKAFLDAQLQDMSDADVTSFVHHWHDAIDRSKLDDQELSSLAEARASLPAKLDDAANRRIRELCNTPLLCAMICVLHWKEEGYLPKQRVEVYERCCDMLIEARDHKRGVLPPPGAIAAMSKSDKEMVLQQLAIEMMHNRDDTDAAADDSYRIEISREKALAWIEPRITRFQSNDARKASSSQVLDYLVERTGLLREPAVDLIDFPHRTFQEYLAACAADADSQESMLAKQADDDQWHETIMLAAGTSTGGVAFGRKLIENLIKRGERHQSLKGRSQRIRKTCFALALGCLENLRQQDEDLRESVLSNLGELVPPRDDGDARILSVAGDAAVSYLSYSQWKDENTATISACAKSLRLIGTTEAIKALARGYSSDARHAVVAEVCRSGAFKYSSIPLVLDSIKNSGKVPRFADTSDIALLEGISELRELEIDLAEAKNINTVSHITGLEAISAEHVNENSNFLYSLPSTIATLRLSGTGTPHGSWVSNLPDLRTLTLIGFPENEIIRIIDEAIDINSLSVVASKFDNAASLKRIMGLTHLYLAGLSQLKDITPLKDHEALTHLSLEECPRLNRIPLNSGFGNLESLYIEQAGAGIEMEGRLSPGSKLKSLSLFQVSGIEQLDAFGDADLLERVELAYCNNINNLDLIANFEKLREIELYSLDLMSLIKLPTAKLENISLSSVSSVTEESFGDGIPQAHSVSLERCVKLDSVDFLSNSSRLTNLRLSMMPRLSSLNSISGLRSMSSLELIDCDGIESIQFIEELNLEELRLISMDGIQNFDSIAALQSLKSLAIVSCDGLKDLSFAMSLPGLEAIWLNDQNSSVHIPESLLPKITRSPPGRGVYVRQRKPWWRDETWMLQDFGRSVHYRRFARSRPYRWIN